MVAVKGNTDFKLILRNLNAWVMKTIVFDRNSELVVTEVTANAKLYTDNAIPNAITNNKERYERLVILYLRRCKCRSLLLCKSISEHYYPKFIENNIKNLCPLKNTLQASQIIRLLSFIY